MHVVDTIEREREISLYFRGRESLSCSSKFVFSRSLFEWLCVLGPSDTHSSVDFIDSLFSIVIL